MESEDPNNKFRIFPLFLLVSGIVVSGCVTPAHAPGKLELEGAFEEGARRKVERVVITRLRAWDADEVQAFLDHPGDYPSISKEVGVTDTGTFSVELEFMKSGGYWIFPPLGSMGIETSLPVLLVYFPDRTDEIYQVKFPPEKKKAVVKTWNRTQEEWTPPDEVSRRLDVSVGPKKDRIKEGEGLVHQVTLRVRPGH